MPKAPKRIARAARESRTMTLSQRSEALLATMTRHTGIPRGRIVDLALDCVEICDDCQGAGVVAGPMGEGTEHCSGCAGNKIRPVHVTRE